ncbi:hypothetical protein RBU49_07000 [Clostridium sp. MB40-C1]|uniref:hypothetical protein n=1 Tax=Clostridium sp. MB40-C1 TaxID=3070996 RepID=UPI0027DFBCE5|nr:hypothetical protein [Clostridium sp. MB40-C1]WMJ81990.1 hypothetical protein RBU49_07000 [Clostridium sp. MB40-C1]
MITSRDRKIINFIDKYGFLTIDQAAKLFFGNFKTQYDIARRRLKKILENGGYIRVFKNTETNQMIYAPEDSKLRKVSKHDLLVMDYVADIKTLGAELEKIEFEKDFDGAIADAFIIFKLGDYRYYHILEVQLRHDYVDINRYKNVINTILNETNNTLPKLIIVQNTNHDYTKENRTDMEIIQLDTSLSDIAKTVI